MIVSEHMVVPTASGIGPARMTLFAPLLLARDAIVVSVHLCTGTILEEVRRFGTGRHLGTINAAVTFVHCPRGAVVWRRRRPGERRRKVGSSGHLDAPLILGIAIPTETEEDEESDYISHRADALVAP